MSRFEVKIALALLIAAVVPLLAALFYASRLAEENLGGAQSARHRPPRSHAGHLPGPLPGQKGALRRGGARSAPRPAAGSKPTRQGPRGARGRDRPDAAPPPRGLARRGRH